MKRALLSLISVIMTFSIARAAKYDGYYIGINGDTVKCKIKVSELLLKKKELNPLSITRSLQVELQNGKKLKFTPSDIRGFKITGIQGEPVEFRRVDGDQEHFYQVWTEGKINLYAFYTVHPYDHSPVPHFFASSISGQFIELQPSNLKQQLSELIKDDKELQNALLRKDYNGQGVVNLIQTYNSRSLISSGVEREANASGASEN